MQTRSAPMILLLMLSFFETTSRGIDPFDRLKFRLGDGYQVIASRLMLLRTGVGDRTDTQGDWADLSRQRGRALFFTRVRARTVEIHRVALSSGRETLVRLLVIPDSADVRTPEWVSATPDGKYSAYSFERVLSDLSLVEGLK
jgi:hypothetical protein